MRKRRIKLLNNILLPIIYKLIKEQRYFTYPLRCVRVPPGVRVPLADTTGLNDTRCLLLSFVCVYMFVLSVCLSRLLHKWPLGY
jgi:hypothetical protein